MKGKWFIVCVVAVVLAACSTLQSLPVDDAYYWPEKHVWDTQTTQTISTTPTIQTTETTEATPRLEYLNVQDTTITVKIKR
jgi:hypothetical protein